MSDAAVDAMIRRVSNWGRWGDEDSLGTLNLITDPVRAEAMASVRTGQPFSLAIPFGRDGPWPAGDRRLNPQHTMLQCGTDVAAGVQPLSDVPGWGYADCQFAMASHAATHWDGLAHAFYDFKMYNDRPCTLVDASGAHANGIENQRCGVVTRGVLVDLPRALGVPWLTPGHRVNVAELERALESQRVEVRSGDALLIRTGNLKRARRDDGWDSLTYHDEPGLALETLPWLHDRDIAAVGADNWAVEAIPNGGDVWLPVHAAGIVHMGLTLGEFFDLDALADACAVDGRYHFLLTAAALPLIGATGSPVNPIAIR